MVLLAAALSCLFFMPPEDAQKVGAPEVLEATKLYSLPSVEKKEASMRGEEQKEETSSPLTSGETKAADVASEPEIQPKPDKSKEKSEPELRKEKETAEAGQKQKPKPEKTTPLEREPLPKPSYSGCETIKCPDGREVKLCKVRLEVTYPASVNIDLEEVKRYVPELFNSLTIIIIGYKEQGITVDIEGRPKDAKKLVAFLNSFYNTTPVSLSRFPTAEFVCSEE